MSIYTQCSSGHTIEAGLSCDQCNAIKHDNGKLPLDLLPFDALEEVAKVLAFGAQKYQANQWRKGMAWSRLYAAALRHISASIQKTDIDTESGLDHLAHACCCLLFLLSYKKTNTGEDDRYEKSS